MKTLLFAAAAATLLGAAAVDPLLESVSDRQADAKASQQRIDALDERDAKLYATYRDTLERSEQTRAYNDQMQRLITSQEQELISIDEQIEEVGHTHQALIPLMHRMISALGEFVDADVPFLLDERRARVRSLEMLMDDAAVNLAEKYRKIMEAYDLENEYGRTIEAYRAELAGETPPRTVDFLRIGRTGLYYLTIDGNEGGVWNVHGSAWHPLDASQRSDVKHGLKIAGKQIAPDLMILPVNAGEAQR